MKNLLYLLAVSIAIASMVSCEKDENVATGLAEGDILSRSSQAPIPQEDPAVFEWTELGEEVEHQANYLLAIQLLT